MVVGGVLPPPFPTLLRISLLSSRPSIANAWLHGAAHFTHFDLGLVGLVCWQPAHMCKVLEHGDEIIQIDGYDTPTKEAIMPLLRGSDEPGSKVDMTVKRV
jgi:hypothetical protein